MKSLSFSGYVVCGVVVDRAVWIAHSPVPGHFPFTSISKIPRLLVWTFLLNWSVLTWSMPPSMCYFQVKSHALFCHLALAHADPLAEMVFSLLLSASEQRIPPPRWVSCLLSYSPVTAWLTKDFPHCIHHYVQAPWGREWSPPCSYSISCKQKFIDRIGRFMQLRIEG